MMTPNRVDAPPEAGKFLDQSMPTHVLIQVFGYEPHKL